MKKEVSKKFKKMADLYYHFSSPWHHVMDMSDEALINMYNHESRGTPLSENNGYACGKSWLNWQVKAWKEGIADGTFFAFEFYEDPKYPHWWLDQVLANDRLSKS